MGHPAHGGTFFGSATMNSKGQVVVPIQAREELGLSEGDNLLVFGLGNDMIALAKPSAVKEFASQLSKKVASMQEALKKSSNE